MVISNAWHHRSDSLSSAVAVVGIAGTLAGYPLLDPLAGMVVAALIARMGLQVCVRVSQCMAGCITRIEVEQVMCGSFASAAWCASPTLRGACNTQACMSVSQLHAPP